MKTLISTPRIKRFLRFFLHCAAGSLLVIGLTLSPFYFFSSAQVSHAYSNVTLKVYNIPGGSTEVPKDKEIIRVYDSAWNYLP